MIVERYKLAAALAVSALFLGSLTPLTRAQTAKVELSPVGSEIRDSAKMFSAETVRKVKDLIDQIERDTKVAVRIETVESVGNVPVATAASQKVRDWVREQSDLLGVLVLIDKADHRFEVMRTPALSNVLTKDDLTEIRDAFIKEFKRGQFDEGLLAGVHAIEGKLIAAKRENKLPRLAFRRLEDGPSRTAERFGIPSTDLILKNQVRLTLPGARLLIAGAQAKAVELKLKMNIAVVDDGGHLLSFDRMDGARPASGYTAITKATSAATFRAETGPLPKGATSPDPLLNLSLQNAATASGGKVTTLFGGVPVIVEGQVIGAVGVGGGTGEQDAEVARAGVARFLSGLATEPNVEK